MLALSLKHNTVKCT